MPKEGEFNNILYKGRCCWVLSKIGEPIVYCNKKVKYKMVRDDDHNLTRKYDSFCEEHMLKAKEEDDE